MTNLRRTYTFGLPDRLRATREAAGLDQRGLAEATGISAKSIYNYENGATRPRRLQIEAWARTTGYDAQWLETGHAESATEPGPTDVAWRAPVGALANDDARLVWARLVAAPQDDPCAGLPPAKASRATTTLEYAGLVRREGDRLVAVPQVFRDLLAAAARPQTGVDRFLTNGRIATYPASPSTREDLLRWVVDRTLHEGESLTEPQFNERLATVTDDVATLRRYLIEFRLIARDPVGENYRRI